MSSSDQIRLEFSVQTLHSLVTQLVAWGSSDGGFFTTVIRDPIILQLQQLEDRMANIADEITQLKSSVANLQSVDASAVTLLQGINAKYQAALDAAKAAGASDAQLQDFQDLIDQINTQNSQLAAAVSANTPAPATTISGGVGDTTGGAGSSVGGGLGDTTSGAGGPTVSGAGDTTGGAGADTSLGAAGANNPNSVSGAADTVGGTVQTTV